MIDLASYLVRDEVVSRKQMEEALKRQAIYGGGLDTVLLELDLVDEVRLSSYLARALNLGVGSTALLQNVDTFAQRLLPARLAIEKRVLPVRLEGSHLVVLVAPEVDLQELESLAFMLSLEMVALVIPEVRMYEALADHYRVPAPVRMVALWRQLGPARLPGAGVAPPLATEPPGRNRLQTLLGIGITGAPPGAELVAELIRRAQAGASEEELLEAALAGTAASVPATDQAVIIMDAGEPPPPGSPEDTPPPIGEETTDPSVHAIELAPRGERLTALELPRAVARLTVAQHREQVVRALLGAAWNEVPFAAFLLHRRGELRGVAAVGSDGTRIHLGGLHQVLSGPSLAAGVIQSQRPYVGPAWSYPADQLLLQQLGRAPVWLGLLPVVLRRRVVALLYLDAVDQARLMTLVSALGPVLDLAAEALARLVIRRRELASAAPRAGRRPSARTAAAPPRALEVPPDAAAVAASSLEPEAAPPEAPAAFVAEVTLEALLPGPDEEPTPVLDDDAVTPIPGESLATRRAEAAGPPGPDEWGLEETSGTGIGPRPLSSIFDLAWSTSPGQVQVRERPVLGADSLEEALALAAEELRQTVPPSAMTRDYLVPSTPSWSQSAAPLPTPVGRAVTEVALPTAAPEVVRVEVRAPVNDGDRIGRGLSSPPAARPEGPAPWVSSGLSSGPGATIPVMPIAALAERVPVPAVEEILAWLEAVDAGGDEGGQAADRLVSAGTLVLPFLSRRFPGRLLYDRFRIQAGVVPPAPTEHGPLLQLVSRLGKGATSMLLKLSGASDLDVRYYATVLLAREAEPAILPALAARLYDADPPTRDAALRGLGRLLDAPGIIPVLDRLRADLLGPDRVRQKYAIQGVGALRHGPAVPRLIELLEHKERGIAAAAKQALVVLTRQDFSDSSRKWRTWWEKNREGHRVEWLIDALAGQDLPLAQAASEELTQLTEEHFGYYADLPRREREQAHKRWVEWWQEKGQKRFGG